MLKIVEKLEEKIKSIDSKMVAPENLNNQKKLIELNRERSYLEDVLKIGSEYKRIKLGILEAEEILDKNEDKDLVEMAREELYEFKKIIGDLEKEFKVKLLPHDPTDDKPAIIELRAGTGGDEAGIFVGDIYKMFQRYAETKGWKLEVLNSSPSTSGGFKEVIFSLSGEGTYGLMKYESGVHRVQRVPLTETQGRVHTSAISVAVLPEVEAVDIDIAEKDLKVDVYRSSGPGGQSVNTTDSAVRLTYLPTGLVVICQDEKSQIKNKVKAMKVLRARLYDAKMQEQQEKLSAERRIMISSGDRSAKIRTYNYPQSRVTDHRISLTLYRLDEVMNGDLDLLITPLRQHEQEEKLKIQSEM